MYGSKIVIVYVRLLHTKNLFEHVKLVPKYYMKEDEQQLSKDMSLA